MAPPLVYLTLAPWRLASRRSWWPRACWMPRSGRAKVETQRTRCWLSFRGDKRSSKP